MQEERELDEQEIRRRVSSYHQEYVSMMLRWVGIDDDCAAYLSDYRNVLAARPGISWRPPAWEVVDS